MKHGIIATFALALVSLSGNPAVRLPPTTDRVLAERAVQALAVQDSSAVGDALYTALGAVAMAPRGDDGSKAPAAIVLLSDGQNTVGRAPTQAADEARREAIQVKDEQDRRIESCARAEQPPVGHGHRGHRPAFQRGDHH